MDTLDDPKQVIGILAEGEARPPVDEVCRKHGISSTTYYQ
jgi:hypothetical protein